MSTAASARGFTLIEVLVVVVIISIVAGVLLVSVRTTGTDERAVRALTGLQARFSAACEDSQITNRNHGLAVGRHNYDLLRETAGGAWLYAAAGPRSSQVALVDGLEFSLESEGTTIELGPELPERPNVLCYGSGEMTPFTLALIEPAAGETVAALTGDVQGRLELVSGS